MKVRIYTDGACSGNPGPGGWAAIILMDEDNQEMSGYEEDTTNNRMELMGVVESLRFALSITDRKIDIFTDSAYVVNAVNNRIIDRWARNDWLNRRQEDIKNKDLWIRLVDLLKKSPGIRILKVTGHSDNKYNDVVDGLAKREIAVRRKW